MAPRAGRGLLEGGVLLKRVGHFGGGGRDCAAAAEQLARGAGEDRAVALVLLREQDQRLCLLCLHPHPRHLPHHKRRRRPARRRHARRHALPVLPPRRRPRRQARRARVVRRRRGAVGAAALRSGRGGLLGGWRGVLGAEPRREGAAKVRREACNGSNGGGGGVSFGTRPQGGR